MSAHTPGPWEAWRPPDQPNYFEVHLGPDFAAELIGPHGRDGELVANAALIAAAPELLEAVRWMAQTVHQAHHEQPIAECQSSVCVHAREVVAKAGDP